MLLTSFLFHQKSNNVAAQEHCFYPIKIHADWVDEWLDSYDITTENIESIIQKEIADCFVQVLECAGVYKRTEKGFAAFKRFLSVL